MAPLWRTGWLILLVPLATLLLSVFLSPATNLTVRVALAGFLIFAAVRPEAALLFPMALIGFGTILGILAGVPSLRVTEVLIVGALAGYCVRQALMQREPIGIEGRRWIFVPVTMFGVAAAASTIVWLKVQQVQTAYPSEFLQLLYRFFTRDYFIDPGDFWFVVSTLAILEGVGLYLVVGALCRKDPAFFGRGLRMLTVGGAGAGLMSLHRLAEIYLENPQAIERLRNTWEGLRISPQIPDFIAAGSYFALCWAVALGLLIASRRLGALWLLAILPLTAALYLTGSRSVIAAALAGLVVIVLVLIRQRAAVVRRVSAFAAVAVVIMIVGYPWWTGRDVSGPLARQSLQVRVELARTGLRVIETRPLFGVGVDRFHVLAGGLASPELKALFPARKNPHNDLLRFAAELGVIGLLLFLCILGVAGREIWKALRTARDARLAGLVGGLAAFLVTGMVSNPLMVREVSYAFWIAMGLAVGYSTVLSSAAGHRQDAAEPTARPSTLSRWQWPVASVLGALLIFSIPLRARQEVADADLAHVSYGLYEWGTDPDGTRSRWSQPEFTMYVDARSRIIEIPMSGIALRSNVVRRVEIRVDGRLADQVEIGAEWKRVRMALPGEASGRSRRLDFVVAPAWVPAQEMEGSTDTRVLGVKVGELKVISEDR